MQFFHNESRAYRINDDGTIQLFTNRVKVKYKKDGTLNYNWVSAYAPFYHECNDVLEAWGKTWVFHGRVVPIQGQYRAPVKVVVQPTRWWQIAGRIMAERRV